MGQHITTAGQRIAILSIDPSSSLTQGSILGDKTRMSTLSKNPRAYIRPTPAGHHLGGIGSKTKETILLCEAAGYNTIFIETVGVGQSETEIYNMSDAFILLIEPGAGDELQGIKRGIMELADLIIITKSDTHPDLTNRSLSSYRHAAHILTAKAHGHPVCVIPHDSLVDHYAGNTWLAIQKIYDHVSASSYLQARRQEQDLKWLDQLINNRIIELTLQKNNIHKYIDELKLKISGKHLSVPKAAQLVSHKILDDYINE
ncbi:UNVERIFIED_CONTAM: hypothetical protein GTU68_000366 [Idotea baltica]|nr:hypothetical protein [Idotea baltica]